MPVFKFRNLNTGQATPIPPGEYTVGREDNTHVHVEDSSVSRLHARIFNLDEGLFVEDAGSVNGTAAHGAFITSRMKISYGDVVHIGSVPFRVDPEVVGEPEPPPVTGMRPVNRAYMSRDTEKIPAMGEAPRVVETISPERLSAPAVSQTGDADAEDLNAIVMREPEPPPVTRLPVIRPGVRPAPESNPAIPASPMLLPKQIVPPKPQTEQKISRHISTSSLATQRPAPTPAPTPKESVEPARAESAEAASGTWLWQLIIFLAGLGVGLLLGLIFAKIFIDMGGKPASLP